MVTNLVDKILTFEEFEKLDTTEQRERLLHWRNEHTNIEIRKQMGLNNSKFYNLIKEFNLPTAPRSPRKETKKRPYTRKKKEIAEEPIAQNYEGYLPILKQDLTSKEDFDPFALRLTEIKPRQEVIYDGLNLSYNGTYKAEQIQRTLKKFSAILDEEPEDFYVELKIMEKKPKTEEDEGSNEWQLKLPF